MDTFPFSTPSLASARSSWKCFSGSPLSSNSFMHLRICNKKLTIMTTTKDPIVIINLLISLTKTKSYNSSKFQITRHLYMTQKNKEWHTLHLVGCTPTVQNSLPAKNNNIIPEEHHQKAELNPVLSKKSITISLCNCKSFLWVLKRSTSHLKPIGN